MNDVVMEATDLARSYAVAGGLLARATSVRALNGVSFRLRRGKTLAVVGESGCGKSTLARLVTLIEEPTSGRLTIDGKQASVGDTALRHRVQIVFQDPYGSLNPRQKVGSILEEPLLLARRGDAAARRAKVAETMRAVGLRPEFAERFPHMFSGGQRQRIAIARALMLEPEVLVLDEPVSALDLSVRAQILNLLAELQDRLGLAYLFISHDLSVVRHVADDLMVMYLGRAVETGPAAAIFAHPRHPYTAALLSATPVADPTRPKARIRLQGELPSPLNPPTGCAFHPRCWKAGPRCKTEAPALVPAGPTAHACHYPLSEGEAQAVALI